MINKIISGIKDPNIIKEIISSVESDSAIAEKQLNEILLIFEKYKEASPSASEKADKELENRFALLKAISFYIRECYDDAWEILSKLPEDSDDEICLQKGITLVKKKDYDKALVYFRKALQFPNVDKARVYFDMGMCWFEAQQYEKAIQQFNEAIVIKNNYWPAYNIKALALRRLGKINDAIEELNKIVIGDKNNDKAYYNLACYYSLLNEPKEAYKNLKRSLELNPNRKDRLEKDLDFTNVKYLAEFQELAK